MPLFLKETVENAVLILYNYLVNNTPSDWAGSPDRRNEVIMERKVGTVSRGIRGPIIREGDDLAKIVVNSVLEAAESEGYELRDRDVVAVTESVVARAQGNYASVDAIAADVRAKLGGDTIGVIFPILSRNRFAICLRGIARGVKKIVLMLSYPSDLSLIHI